MLDAGGPEVVRSDLHSQTIDTDHPRLATNDLFSDEVLTCRVSANDGVDQVLRHVAVVGQQLLGVLGQAVAPVAEAGVVVVGNDVGIS